MNKKPKNYSDYFFDQMAYAGFWVRIFAASLDLSYLLAFLGTFYFSLFHFFDFQNIKFYIYFGIFSHAFYYIFLTCSRWQATIGKKTLCIFVGNVLDESRISFWESVGRYIFSIISTMFFLINFVLLAFSEEKTAFHDLMCKTRVFYGKY
ncbi:MAG: putative RDD family membrane protein YckC [Lentimonas sp.]|jgi:uncharacterized RDD family membrane protein YckC